MKIFEIDDQGFPRKILVSSFSQYVNLGGKKDKLDAYYQIKTKAKATESKYISLMDMSLSGFEVDEKDILKAKAFAQTYWGILHLWFDKPLRVVNFNSFDLAEFNRL